jgi:hypothetical protein
MRVLQISVQGRKLKNLDKNRDKSDTQVTMKMKWQKGQQEWSECDRTEMIPDNLDPNYVHTFHVLFNFGQPVEL